MDHGSSAGRMVDMVADEAVSAEAPGIQDSGQEQQEDGLVKKSKKKALDLMNEVKRRNWEKETEYAHKITLESHMRERLAQIRAMVVPPEIEPTRQEIIERYEHDLATWVK